MRSFPIKKKVTDKLRPRLVVDIQEISQQISNSVVCSVEHPFMYITPSINYIPAGELDSLYFLFLTDQYCIVSNYVIL